jgi:ubiquinone/menaquinone biosynthesis C-methylase UbiE
VSYWGRIKPLDEITKYQEGRMHSNRATNNMNRELCMPESGMDSYVNVEQIIVPLQACGKKGSVLDINCGMGRLVKDLISAGFDAKGMDVSERIIAANRQIYGDIFICANVFNIPFPSKSFDTVVSTRCLGQMAAEDQQQAVSEIARVTTKSVLLTIAYDVEAVEGSYPSTSLREWWEAAFFRFGFRRHPRMLEAVPFASLEDESSQIRLFFEKDPNPHCVPTIMDWGKRSGRDADAYMAFYSLCSKFVLPGNRVLDIQCGSGFGGAILAASCPAASVSAIDEDKANIDHAKEHYAASYGNLVFRWAISEPLRENDKFDVITLRIQSNQLEEKAVWTALEKAEAVLNDGGLLLVEYSNQVEPTADYESIRFSENLKVEDLIFPRLGKLIPKHLYRLHWKKKRELREIKLPLCGKSMQSESYVVAYAKERAHSIEVCTPRQDKVVVLGHHPCGMHYKHFLYQCPFPVEFVQQFGIDWEPPLDAGLVMSLETYDEPGVSALRSAVERGVPTLILADGIIEYNNTWQRPQSVPGAILQPVIGHKIACIGDSQARILASWGNYGKCEVIGIPRLDRFRGLHRPSGRIDRRLRVLIATAKTPYFTQSQRHAVMNGLQDLRRFFKKDSRSQAPEFEAIWRIAEDLEAGLRLGNSDHRAQQEDIADALLSADALITTPSTLLIEGMLIGIPVCLLDYGNTPHYFKTSWQITAPSHIEPTLRAMQNPSPAENLFQEYALHDLCACETPAIPRLYQLMEKMIECGRQARLERKPLRFPPRIITRELSEIALPENSYEFEKLYPSVEQERTNDLNSLRYEVRHLRKIIASRESYLNSLERGLRDFEAELLEKQKAVSKLSADLLDYKSTLKEIHAGWSHPSFISWLVSSMAHQRPVYCWGAGEAGSQLIQMLGNADRSITAFIDINPSKQGNFWGRSVHSPEILWNMKHDARPFVIITSIYCKEIAAELEANGYKIGQDYIALPTIDKTI